MMIKTTVWLTDLEGGILPAGELIVADPDANGVLRGQFRYDPNYLRAPGAFALDPVCLPLSDKIFDVNRPYAGVHGVFEDCLPDDWGRRLLIRRYNLTRQEQRVPHLLRLLKAEGFGALSFSEEQPPPKSVGPPGHALEKLLLLAELYEKGDIVVENDLAMLFEAGSSPGGARPKAMVNYNGKACLVKFPSITDKFDVVALEAASMALAEQAGLNTAPTELTVCGARRAILVERFDVTPAGGRRHLVSMQTLTGAEGHYYLGYRDMADVIRRISASPAKDLNQLYRQMIFNVLLGNTDDHLKNFCMLHGENGWRLSPAFDLVPNIAANREHSLRIGLTPLPQNRLALLGEAPYFGIKQQHKATGILEAIHVAVSDWQKVYSHFDVPGDDMEKIGKDISARLTKMKSP